ncbi:MAG: hypothetical protein A2927_03315 [Candidatus Komeilibacteria bacterium RIFCSPLOWO2_01_FULL_45_10]|uniref:Ribulose-phosphate 3-epimerase n=1 Tax=Candidatus Komeilibacteria bacterium RIFCSPLOWO2_01_FULL_45_10 TaxID=1798550 RepID=A0A1G2BKK3_9BACT|nr:MAG: hypothetical protein A2927_03315 [Candidatus Komeilibacteria bacterium RIFCSPLOWO2_01_FULL_45_10]
MSGAWVAPSFLGVPAKKLENFLLALEYGGANLIHVDLGDSCFIEENSDWSIFDRLAETVKGIPLDFHLMVDNLGEWLDFFIGDVLPKLSREPYLTIHQEAAEFSPDLIENLKPAKVKLGLAIKPETPVSAISQYLRHLALVNVMTVVPGKSNQQMIAGCLAKATELIQLRDRYRYRFKIQFDGGVKQETAQAAVNAGGQILVCGGYLQSATEDSEEMRRRILWLQNLKKDS